MIEKEIRGKESNEDRVMKLFAKNDIELDQYILAEEFFEDFKKAKEEGFEGNEEDYAKEYYRKKFNDGGKADRSFNPNTAKELFDRIEKTMSFRQKLNKEDLEVIDILLEKSGFGNFKKGKK